MIINNTFSFCETSRLAQPAQRLRRQTHVTRESIISPAIALDIFYTNGDQRWWGIEPRRYAAIGRADQYSDRQKNGEARRADDGDAEEHDQFNGRNEEDNCCQPANHAGKVSCFPTTKKTTKETNAGEERSQSHRET